MCDKVQTPFASVQILMITRLCVDAVPAKYLTAVLFPSLVSD